MRRLCLGHNVPDEPSFELGRCFELSESFELGRCSEFAEEEGLPSAYSVSARVMCGRVAKSCHSLQYLCVFVEISPGHDMLRCARHTTGVSQSQIRTLAKAQGHVRKSPKKLLLPIRPVP